MYSYLNKVYHIFYPEPKITLTEEIFAQFNKYYHFIVLGYIVLLITWGVRSWWSRGRIVEEDRAICRNGVATPQALNDQYTLKTDSSKKRYIPGFKKLQDFVKQIFSRPSKRIEEKFALINNFIHATDVMILSKYPYLTDSAVKQDFIKIANFIIHENTINNHLIKSSEFPKLMQKLEGISTYLSRIGLEEDQLARTQIYIEISMLLADAQYSCKLKALVKKLKTLSEINFIADNDIPNTEPDEFKNFSETQFMKGVRKARTQIMVPRNQLKDLAEGGHISRIATYTQRKHLNMGRVAKNTFVENTNQVRSNSQLRIPMSEEKESKKLDQSKSSKKIEVIKQYEPSASNQSSMCIIPSCQEFSPIKKVQIIRDFQENNQSNSSIPVSPRRKSVEPVRRKIIDVKGTRVEIVWECDVSKTSNTNASNKSSQ